MTSSLSSLTPPEIVRHRLQDLLLSADADRTALYRRHVDGSGMPAPDMDAAFVPPGWTLKLDTLLNSFFESYWRGLTDLETVDLLVTTSGPCFIRAVRRRVDGRDTILAEVHARGERVRSALSIALADVTEGGVVHAEVVALDEAVQLHDGGWFTSNHPRNEVRLVVATCSYGRELMLVENLRRVAALVASRSAIAEVLVVHQGPRDLEQFAEYKTLRSTTAFAGKLRVIRQDNFGGTGGFARGMLEALDTGATHILLLDDDIRIEPAVVDRLLALLSHLTAPTTIGGQMLDLREPTVLRASHETVDLDILELKNPCNDVVMAGAEAVVPFGRRCRSDYNAWWFCCIPASTVRKIGLPVPMFIRHDDVEYGVRTVASGLPVVTMPGIFVWHEAFAKKQKASMVYYERRNFMIAGALHGRSRRLHLVRRHWHEAWGALSRNRFEYCWALCRAVEDFLSGPSIVFSALPERHRRLMSDHALPTLMTMASVRRRVRPANRRVLRHLFLARVLVFGARGLDGVEAKFVSTMRPLALATIRTSVLLAFQLGRAGRAYRTDAATFTSPVFWRRLLGMQDTPP